MTVTPRQYQVAMLAAEGLSNPEIGERLGLALGTVRELVRRALERTGARNRVQLAVMYVRGELTVARVPLRRVA